MRATVVRSSLLALSVAALSSCESTTPAVSCTAADECETNEVCTDGLCVAA